MRDTLRVILAGALCVGGAAGAAFGQASVDARVTAQNALFEESFEAGLKASPRRATAIRGLSVQRLAGG